MFQASGLVAMRSKTSSSSMVAALLNRFFFFSFSFVIQTPCCLTSKDLNRICGFTIRFKVNNDLNEGMFSQDFFFFLNVPKSRDIFLILN